jgi:hypothetical protein
MYAGQRIKDSSKSNRDLALGDPTDNYESYEDFYYEEEGEDAPPVVTSFDQIRQASIVQQKAAAARQNRAGRASPSAAAAPATQPWGQAGRVEAMKERLLALEREKIAAMAPDRLELMNLLADRGVNLDEDTISALLAWKKQG